MVGESVVVIKKLLQLKPKENKDLIIQVAKLTDKVGVRILLNLTAASISAPHPLSGSHGKG